MVGILSMFDGNTQRRNAHDGIPNNGMSSNYIRYNMQWVFRQCLTEYPTTEYPNTHV